MTIPIKFFTVVLKKTAVESGYPGGLKRFLEDQPQGLPQDAELVGLRFMSGGELQRFLDLLIAISFDLKQGCAIGEMVLGEIERCPGIEFRPADQPGILGPGWLAFSTCEQH